LNKYIRKKKKKLIIKKIQFLSYYFSELTEEIMNEGILEGIKKESRR